ncbi:MAG: hypothetical protein JNJ54_32885 [Myxococcaceae bacterium]|nr:hypothetical protein [Myxococcaceae bacterium]
MLLAAVLASACPPAVTVNDAGAPDAGDEPPAFVPTCDTERFQTVPQGTLDTVTGVTWFAWSQPGVFAVSEGEAACAAAGGRLPTRAEFEALLSDAPGDGVCSLDACAFEGQRCETFLTGSQNLSADVAWAIDTIGAHSVPGNLGPYKVRCVLPTP